ncbi:MAG: nitrile hydratase accessory protein [Gammaproteobacteria bacterium]|nr:nitrile hydratase accessory protein [Gammaproteobacteria bacterium]MYG12474.1 nitrile hydratase accessory protein [Gammaproteobacteria bacterium]MYK28325.1 nitrile hydratase accessory protein [Gammaproteobacteria bacterium]
MANGELAFAEAWQGRVFGMAWALCESGCFEWREFQASLIEAIARHDESQNAAQDEEYAYYDRFQEALEALLIAKGLATGVGLESRHQALAERPHGHDH